MLRQRKASNGVYFLQICLQESDFASFNFWAALPTSLLAFFQLLTRLASSLLWGYCDIVIVFVIVLASFPLYPPFKSSDLNNIKIPLIRLPVFHFIGLLSTCSGAWLLQDWQPVNLLADRSPSGGLSAAQRHRTYPHNVFLSKTVQIKQYCCFPTFP